MSDQQTITIDGREVPFTEGQTIMDAALAAEIQATPATAAAGA